MLTPRTLSIVDRYKQLKNLRLTGAEFNISGEAVRMHLVKYEKETQTIIWRMYGTNPTGLVWTCKICGKEGGAAQKSKTAKLCWDCFLHNSSSIKHSDQTIKTWLREIENGKTIYQLAKKEDKYSQEILQIIFGYFRRNNQLDQAIDFFRPRSVYWLKKKRGCNWPEFFEKA